MISRLATAAAILLVLAIVAGCATNRAVPATSWCDLNNPILVTEKTLAAMSDDEVADALSHNSYGQKACGWRP